MKKLSIVLGILLIANILNVHAETTRKNSRMTDAEFTLSCVKASANIKRGEGSPALLGGATLGEPVTVRPGYVIQVIDYPEIKGAEHRLVGIIEKDAVSGDPVFTAICLNEDLHPAKSGKPGEIEFKSAKGDPIHVRFHLNKDNHEPGYLADTFWKRAAEDSIWIGGPYAASSDSGQPGEKDWPGCISKDSVIVDGANLKFEFQNCGDMGAGDAYYKYTVRMDRKKSDGAYVNYEIDPQIINHR